MDEQFGNNHAELKNDLEEIRENEFIPDSELVSEKERIEEKEADGDDGSSRAKNNDNEEQDSEDKDNQQQDSSQDSGADAGDGGASAGGGGAAGAGAGAAGAVAVVAAVIIAVSGVISGISAIFEKLEVFGTYFNYALTVSMEYTLTEENPIDFDNFDTGLILTVTKNGFSENVKLVTGGDLNYTYEKTLIESTEDSSRYSVAITFSGTFDGLDENTRYRVAVIGDEDGSTVTYVSNDIKTTARVSEFRGVGSYCSCDKDGNFNFTVDFSDENGFYSDFKYKLISPDGEVVRLGDITDPLTEQHIPNVDQLPGSEYTLVVTFTSSAETDLNADNVITDFNQGSTSVNINNGLITVTINVKI